jgi:hypothetical protein
MIRWEKRGPIFRTDRHHPWMVSHACVPTAMALPNGRIRVYFAPRNERGQSIPTFIEVDGDDPTQVRYIHDRPILTLGERGTFDDGGLMPCSVVQHEGAVYLYYVGWNPSVSVPYRNAVGLAISHDGGVTFERAYRGPIVDRSPDEPFFTASPCVYKDGDIWHMWYASATGFVEVAGKPEPVYVIKYARSQDGRRWERSNHTCIHPRHPLEANARPTVIKEGGRFRMWFCYRDSHDYRDGAGSYRIGYAESLDGLTWDRDDAQAGIAPSDAGWDDKMLAYPHVLPRPEGGHWLFYNGNGFGLTGIGCAAGVEDRTLDAGASR